MFLKVIFSHLESAFEQHFIFVPFSKTTRKFLKRLLVTCFSTLFFHLLSWIFYHVLVASFIAFFTFYQKINLISSSKKHFFLLGAHLTLTCPWTFSTVQIFHITSFNWLYLQIFFFGGFIWKVINTYYVFEVHAVSVISLPLHLPCWVIFPFLV